MSSGPPIHIAATELRGITIEQLSSLQLGLIHRIDRANLNCFSEIASRGKSPNHLKSRIALCRGHRPQLVRSTPLCIWAAFRLFLSPAEQTTLQVETNTTNWPNLNLRILLDIEVLQLIVFGSILNPQNQISSVTVFAKSVEDPMTIRFAIAGCQFWVSNPTEAFNLYHANFWVIGPATAGHGRVAAAMWSWWPPRRLRKDPYGLWPLDLIESKTG